MDMIEYFTQSLKIESFAKFLLEYPPRQKYNIDVGICHNRKIISISNKECTNLIMWYFTSSPLYKTKDDTWILNGEKIQYRQKQDSTKIFNCICSTEKMGDAMNAIISHLLFIFDEKCDFDHLSIKFANLQEELKVAKAISSISEVNHFYLEPVSYNQNVELITNRIKVKQAFSSYSKFCCFAPNFLTCHYVIECRNATWMTKETLLYLNCRFLYLEKTRFTTKDVMDFLKKWKNSTGDEMANIGLVEMTVPYGVDLDCADLGAKCWNPKKRPRIFKLRIPEMRTIRDPKVSINMENAFDIERADGRIASFGRIDQIIRFVAWHQSVPS